MLTILIITCIVCGRRWKVRSENKDYPGKIAERQGFKRRADKWTCPECKEHNH